jgi:hypothetical protein
MKFSRCFVEKARRNRIRNKRFKEEVGTYVVSSDLELQCPQWSGHVKGN